MAGMSQLALTGRVAAMDASDAVASRSSSYLLVVLAPKSSIMILHL
jgi:hypothetical protein